MKVKWQNNEHFVEVVSMWILENYMACWDYGGMKKGQSVCTVWPWRRVNVFFLISETRPSCNLANSENEQFRLTFCIVSRKRTSVSELEII